MLGQSWTPVHYHWNWKKKWMDWSATRQAQKLIVTSAGRAIRLHLEPQDLVKLVVMEEKGNWQTLVGAFAGWKSLSTYCLHYTFLRSKGWRLVLSSPANQSRKHTWEGSDGPCLVFMARAKVLAWEAAEAQIALPF